MPVNPAAFDLDRLSFPFAGLPAAGAATDYHLAVRDAAADTMATALAAVGFGSLAVERLDDVEQITKVVSLPCVAVCPVGPELYRPNMATNLRDGVTFPVMVSLHTIGTPNVEKSAAAPDVTKFRRVVWVAFSNKRLAGVSQVAWCEVSPNPVEFDRESSAFARLTTASVVNAIGRFPRS